MMLSYHLTLLLPFLSCVAATKCRLQPKGVAQHAQAPLATVFPSTDITASATHDLNNPQPTPSTTPFDYSKNKIRGVNLGGWFVLEPWITPSIFERTGNENIVDEYTLGLFMARDAAEELLKSHWETWITEDDFAAMKAAGLNHVRIPLGYWSVPLPASATSTSTSPSPYIPGAWPHFLRALNWAKKHSLHVIVDIHGAPGSQNGYDNSGQRTNDPQWALNPANVTRTLDTIRWLSQNIGGMVDIIELLNEAAGFRGPDWQNTIRQFWLDGYDIVRSITGDKVGVMIGDAFMGLQSWTNFLTAPRGHNVLLDFHEYQIFSDLELNRTLSDHLAFACTYKSSLSSFSSSNIWTVVGEWSAAVTDCARWLNGRGVGSRWDATWFPDSNPSRFFHGSCNGWTGSWNGKDGGKGFSEEYRDMLRRYWEVQVEVGEEVQGWVFWTWKAENADEWSYQKGLEGGWIPKDPTDRKYPNICN